MTICYKYCVDLLCGRWPHRIEVAHIVEVYLSKLVRTLHANLHLYFNLHVRLSLYPCVSHTSPFFRVHSTRCLIRPLLKLGYYSKAKPVFLVIILKWNLMFCWKNRVRLKRFWIFKFSRHWGNFQWIINQMINICNKRKTLFFGITENISIKIFVKLHKPFSFHTNGF